MGNSITCKYAFLPPQNKYSINAFEICHINNRHVPYYIINSEFPSNGYIIFSHGNAEDISTSIECMRRFSKIVRCNIIGYDYTGYGSNIGDPSESNCDQDILAIFLMAVKDMNIPQQNIALMGHSIGCGPTLWLANQIQLDKLKKYNIQQGILGSVLSISGFTSACAVVDQRLTYIPFTDIFNNENTIKELKMPVFIAHGLNDTIIHVSHATRLSEAIKCKDNFELYLVEDCGHNDIFSNIEFQTAILSFIESYFQNHLIN
ncbi:hypothetical protein EHI8A_058410 [Entamoeba histolytica HM-1:IMSS-B]|uniref:Peptidase S9 prolyl oligopeptidase catalytic domain-containing protein n=6 Tax=Entamoeba histolytica TaxID=5759 RepID=C4LYS2_ENTH1|nr:hypothetical protein, conserved [Entamoeba histolytica HM-1:IMSS]EMD47321.1 phospholipase/carboxylesterase family protein [Entamoeba histolytica KU27]EMH77693.1 hypothetical protein EHI8A_058410 [Entamoeba histolytica HM-1:IMSS-B]EMS11701.1 hypothetical protein KM1_116480 [Entamoeba histolytica HM-3:IMSS]ENY65857.1 hypothetical protein EHI7A_057170 [Entamoeba histolytica HM-1:IMSS-A]GAT93984.1 hypothetical protein conserved [Entamoeba histolytica]|eukprot:XP_650008.1 hypothetical protein, conserved [Entamoeba histolytica HM-1:IMSS]